MAELVEYRKRGEVENGSDGEHGEVALVAGGAESASDGEGLDDQDELIGPSKVRYRHSELSLKKKLAFLGIVLVVVVAIVVAAVVHGKSSSCDSEGEDKKYVWWNVRLPSEIRPINYTINLHPNLTTFAVTGDVEVDINVTSSTQYVILHTKDMVLSQTSLSQKSGGSWNKVQVSRTFNYSKNDFFVVEASSALSVGVYRLKMAWTSELSKSLVGFYRSEYQPAGSTEKRYLATTQFEPTDARKAFPCFDEPAMKAVFTISIVHDKQHSAVSNMDIARNETLPGGLIRTHFNPTAKMSTYLVAFVVSDFKHITSHTTGKGGCKPVKIRLWSRPASIAQTQYALTVATSVLEYYETFFNTCYPLPKQDLFAIPDFAAGAMENWGLITYRETAVLYDPASSSTSDQQWVAIVISHELAHQWFGNLVTMAWWSGLWLNEGFASFVEYTGTNHVQPTWNMYSQFLVDTEQRALHSDSVQSSHPVLVEVQSPDQINEIFDSISYQKGASVLRMLKGVMGENLFLRGIQHYLHTHRYGNAKTSELWASMDVVSKASSPSMTEFMDTWTLQMGFPYITVNSNLQLTQQRYLVGASASKTSKYSSPFGYTWYVPINYRTDLELAQEVKFFGNGSYQIQVAKQGYKWIKLNIRQLFFYRVNYDEKNWNALINQLKTNHSVFTAEDRTGLIDDAFAMASAGHINITIALGTTQYLHKELDYAPWLTAINSLNTIYSILSHGTNLGGFKTYFRSKLESALSILGYNDTGSHTERLLRVAALHRSCDLGSSACVQQARKAIMSWMAVGGPSPVKPNFRYTYYATAVANGDEAVWDFFWSVYQNASTATEKRKCMYALGQSKIPWILKRYLTWSLNRDIIRPQDALSVISYVALNPYGRDLAWVFVQEKWDQILTQFGTGSFSFSRLIMRTTAHYTSQFRYDQVKAFFDAHPNAASGTRAIQQSLESIQANINWRNLNEAIVMSWLSQAGT